MQNENPPNIDRPAPHYRPPCLHKLVYQALVCWPSKNPRPGSGAHDRWYGEQFFCEQCLTTRVMRARVIGNTYEKILNDAIPLTDAPEGQPSW